jgi:gliding motility-associated-like protein/uncharacterized repeat protein (TIGR01451 family)
MKKFVVILLLNILLPFGIFMAAQIPRNNLVAYFPFNGNANDESGHGNNGIVMNATLTTDRFNIPDRAYYFDDLDYIIVPDADILRISGPITISAWIQCSYSQKYAAIICKANAVEPRAGYLMFMNDNEHGRVDIHYNHIEGKYAAAVSVNKLTDGNWHHLLGEYDGTQVKLYVDGLLNASTQAPYGINTNNEPFLIGWDQNQWLAEETNRHFSGKIDEVMLYNRALDETEIMAISKLNPAHINGQEVICPNDKELSYSVLYMDGYYSYLWDYSGGGASISGTGTSIKIDFDYTASSGTLTVYGLGKDGVIADSASLNLAVNQLVQAFPKSNSPVCFGSALSLSANTVIDGVYHWSGPNGFTSSVQNPVITEVTEETKGEYFLTISFNGCVSAPAGINVDVSQCSDILDLTIVQTVSNLNPAPGQEITFTILAVNNSGIPADNVNVTDLLKSGYNYVSSVASSGIYDPATGIWEIGELRDGSTQVLTITVTVNEEGDYINSAVIQSDVLEVNMGNNYSMVETIPFYFNIPNCFTPNGDGTNDYFEINGLKDNSRLLVFDRLGNKVFESPDYQNQWSGKDMNDNILKTDTYWYVLSMPGIPSDFKGFVFLKK